MTATPSREQVHELLVPAGQTCGSLTVTEIVVSKEAADLERMRSIFSGGRGAREGTYRGIKRDGTMWMSDTHDEWMDQYGFISHAYWSGAHRILVTGLGLGMTPTALILIGVPTIDIVDISPDCCELVGTHVQKIAAEHGVTVNVHCADAYLWKPAKDVRYDMAWHDVWPYLTSDNLPEMGRMRRHYQSRMVAPHTQSCWGEIDCRRQARRDRGAWWNR